MEYKCCKCNKEGVKLWRMSHSCDLRLTCYMCSGEKHSIDDTGKIQSHQFPSIRTDQLQIQGFSYVPAVPDEENKGSYYGYTCVPDKDIQKWQSLPNIK